MDDAQRTKVEQTTATAPRAGTPRRAEGRRRELAQAALLTLSRAGYAKTGLRDIAAASDFSHGVLHYYFRDKGELIGECLRLYMAECAVDHDADIAAASSPDECARLFAASLAATIDEGAQVHRLWYDLRNQATFEGGFRDEVAELNEVLQQRIWRAVSHYAELAGAEPVLDAQHSYEVVDGLFRGALERRLTEGSGSLGDFESAVRALLPGLVRPKA